MHNKMAISCLICSLVGALTLGFLATSPTVGPAKESDVGLSHFELGKSLQSQGKIPESLAEFRRFLSVQKAPASLDLLRQQMEAALYLIAHQTDTENQSLIRNLSDKLRDNPSNLGLFYLRLSAYFGRANRLDLAKRYVTQAIPLLQAAHTHASSPSVNEALLRLGRVLEQSGDLNGAEEAFQKVLSSQDTSSLRWRLNGVFALANLYVQNHRIQDANALLRSAETTIGSTSAAPAFYYRLYHFYVYYDRTAEADRCYNKCLNLARDFPSLKSLSPAEKKDESENYRWAFLSHFYLAKLFQDRHEWSRSIQEFEALVNETMPNRGMATRWVQSAAALLSLYESAGQSKEHIEAFIAHTLQKIANRPRLLALFLHHVAGYYERQKQMDAVKIHARRLLEILARLPMGADSQVVRWQSIAYFRLANVLVGEGERAQAAAYYHKMLLAPNYGPYFFKSQIDSAFQLVGLYNQMGRSSEVDKIFQEAARKVEAYLQPNRARFRPLDERGKTEILKIAVDFYYRAAQYYDKAGQKKTAEHYLQNLVQLKKKSVGM